MSGNQAELAALIHRLEAVTLRLEKVPGGGGAAGAKDGGKEMFKCVSLSVFLSVPLSVCL